MGLSRGAALFISAAGVLMLGCGDPTAPPNPTPLAAPTDLTIQELASGDIEVSWHDNSANERSFELVRSSSGPSGAYSVLAWVDADVSTYQDSEIDSVSEYCYRVRALGPSGTAPSLLSTTICHQFRPPIAPSQLAATGTFGQVDLSWSDNSDNEGTFQIWKATDGANGTFTPAASVAAGVTEYSNTGLQDGSEYCYRVRAVGTKGQTSSFSNTVCATTLVPTTPPPDPPTNLAASASSAAAISLVWNDNSSSEEGFELWRSTAGPLGTYALLSTVGANTTNSADTGLTAGTQYCYLVRAVGGAAVPPSDFSNSSCATTPAAPLAAPTNLLATAVTTSRIDLAWQDNATGEEQYEIWRSTTGASGSFAIRASRAANTEVYSDLGLSSGAEYCYKVRAVGANGAPDSPFGGPSCAGTPMPTVVRVTLFGDSNTDTCEEDPNRKSSYISIVPRLGPNDAHRPCQVAGKVEAKWQAARSETIHAVNHAIASTTSGGGSFGGPNRSNQGSPNARTSVNGVTRFEAEILGMGYPWSGGEPTNQYFPTGPVTRVNAYVPAANDFVYVSMGTNDASATRNMTVAQTDANLRWMVQRWIAAGRSPDHFMLTTLAPRASTNTPTAIPDRNVLIRALAAELGVHFIDLAHFVSDDDGLTWRDPSLHIGDGTHYTDAVRAWLADEVVSWMSSVTPQ